MGGWAVATITISRLKRKGYVPPLSNDGRAIYTITHWLSPFRLVSSVGRDILFYSLG
ncbi:hypothetical protein [Aquimarina muelleri]|uniref:hypothetical protein n=1 Tax=Aquimarina muelleri TaxID=279356 RepID=UPI0003FEE96C